MRRRQYQGSRGVATAMAAGCGSTGDLAAQNGEDVVTDKAYLQSGTIVSGDAGHGCQSGELICGSLGHGSSQLGHQRRFPD